MDDENENENENEVVRNRIPENSLEGQELNKRLMAYANVAPNKVYPNIVYMQDGETLFMLGMENEAGDQGLCVFFPVHVFKQICLDTLKQIEEFEAEGGVQSRAN